MGFLDLEKEATLVAEDLGPLLTGGLDLEKGVTLLDVGPTELLKFLFVF